MYCRMCGCKVPEDSNFCYRCGIKLVPDRFQMAEPVSSASQSSETGQPNPLDTMTLDEIEKVYILRTLDSCGGNISQAAKALGISRHTVMRKLEKWGRSVADSKDQTGPTAIRAASAPGGEEMKGTFCIDCIHFQRHTYKAPTRDGLEMTGIFSYCKRHMIAIPEPVEHYSCDDFEVKLDDSESEASE
jgi:predicted DNA-binding protein (UPF0251 family)